ncbi:hypothetical protein FHR70_000675 [Microvirga lupini]|uniref:Uncharacterized protein n=1 Tax=Microvirga lupini TaxID=420324 RepID=A0A7W4VI41_9HYPH|nr:hypothetical protein [Microvirga lupini]MBB3017635.1 hypothetical protein [Microvirga lupini]
MARNTTKKPTYRDLERKVMELNGQLAYVYAFASKDIAKASTDHLMASGVLLQLTVLGGREIIKPVVIRDGLSHETIEALKKDLARSFELATHYKP